MENKGNRKKRRIVVIGNVCKCKACCVDTPLVVYAKKTQCVILQSKIASSFAIFVMAMRCPPGFGRATVHLTNNELYSTR